MSGNNVHIAAIFTIYIFIQEIVFLFKLFFFLIQWKYLQCRFCIQRSNSQIILVVVWNNSFQTVPTFPTHAGSLTRKWLNAIQSLSSYILKANKFSAKKILAQKVGKSWKSYEFYDMKRIVTNCFYKVHFHTSHHWKLIICFKIQWRHCLINELISPINILQRLIRTAGCLWQTRLLGNNCSTLVVATFKQEAAFGKHNSLCIHQNGKPLEKKTLDKQNSL